MYCRSGGGGAEVKTESSIIKKRRETTTLAKEERKMKKINLSKLTPHTSRHDVHEEYKKEKFVTSPSPALTSQSP